MSNSSGTWKKLEAHGVNLTDFHMRDLFSDDPKRFEHFSYKHEGLLVDISKNLITQETLSLLLSLAKEHEVENWRDKMFSGEKINATQNRSALHSALRAPEESSLLDNEIIRAEIKDTLDKMKIFSEQVRSGIKKSHSGKKFKKVINIGIGGSDLGPHMVYEALKAGYEEKISVHYVSNIDPEDIEQALKDSNPDETLFIVASKSFTTQETMANASAAKEWLLSHTNENDSIKGNFVALCTNKGKAKEFGINEDSIFAFNEHVGGRFSLCSPIGFSICLAFGFEEFQSLLEGAHSMDKHFCNTPLDQNIPVILGLLGIWNGNFLNHSSHAILPYSKELSYLPAYLQQLDMESNGKSVNREGKRVSYHTSPIIFGSVGTNGQHAFYQLLHQGTQNVSCDFIGIAEPRTKDFSKQHEILLANMLAQSRALMEGRKNEDNLHLNFDGNKPSTTILLPKLDAFNLGMLLAMYEHKTFVQGIIWNINSFDQWGVELGKEMSKDILDNNMKNADCSTNGLLSYISKNTKLFQ